MSLQAYYDMFNSGCWATSNASDCPCHGHGWALSDVDTWHQCPVHFNGQRHPEDDRDDEPCDVVALSPAPMFMTLPAPAPDFSDDIPF